jgi:hypothetical protein
VLKHYRYDTAPDDYAQLGLVLGRAVDVCGIYFDDRPLATSWKPLEVAVFRDDLPLDADFPSLGDYSDLPVFNQRAWDALRPLIGYCCEALPIIHPSGKPYYLIHVMETIDCLDRERSEFTGDGKHGRISWVHRFSLKTEMLKGKHIFKLPHMSGGDLLVDEEFRKVVEANGLKGLLFKPLPMVGDPEPPKPPRPKPTLPEKKRERPLDEDEEAEVRGQIENAREIMSIEPDASPDEIQRVIYEELQRVQSGHVEFDDQEKENIALGLGCLWGQSVCDQLGWRWANITVGETEGIGIIAPDRSLVTYPMSFINRFVQDPDSDLTSLLLYNMLKAGEFKAEPDAFQVVA